MILPGDRYAFASSKGATRKRRLRLVAIFVPLALIAATGIWQRRAIGEWLTPEVIEEEPLLELWDIGRYDEIVLRTDEMISNNPLDADALMYGGFSRFYLSTELYTLEEKLPLVNRAISMLRKSLVVHDGPMRGGIEYVLGKAYHFKGRYYADLAIEYLLRSMNSGYTGNDTHEYLGLAYANLGFYEKSAEYFQLAIEREATDMRYLALAQAYLNAERVDDAEAYLIRAMGKTSDPAVEQRSRFLLGKLYLDLGELTKAEEQYRSILSINPRSADAYYYIGEIYLQSGKPIEARAQWREALIVDPNHYGARLRYYK